MNYKRIVAYIPNTSVIFELENGTYAIVTLSSEQILISEYVDTFLKFGGFEDAKRISEVMLNKAILILQNSKKVQRSSK